LGYLEDKVSRAIESLNKHGYAIVENAIDRQLCEQMLAEVEEIADRELKTGTAYQYGNDLLLQRVYHLLLKSNLSHLLLKNDLLLQILDRFFERPTNHDLFYLSTFAANILHPGAQAQKLHVDENTCDPLASWPIRIDANFILHDYTIDSGGTIIYPGTHNLLRKPTVEEQGGREFMIDGNKYEPKPIIAPAGSIALWTGKVWHKSGINRSSTPRVALLTCFCNSILREMSCEENNSRLLESRRQSRGNTPDEFIADLVGLNHGIKDWSLVHNDRF